MALISLPFGLAGRLPWSYDLPAAAMASAVFCVGNLLIVLTAMRRIRSIRFAGERRDAYRFDVDWPGNYDGRRCRLVDVSLTGAQLEIHEADTTVDRGKESATTSLMIETPTRGQVHLRCQPRRLLGRQGGDRSLGVSFVAGQLAARRNLSLAVFHDPYDAAPHRGRPAPSIPADTGSPLQAEDHTTAITH